jgi:hypothetical protein
MTNPLARVAMSNITRKIGPSSNESKARLSSVEENMIKDLIYNEKCMEKGRNTNPVISLEKLAEMVKVNR